MLDSLIWLGLACLVWFLVYQVFFSPLAPYPGPLLAKISPLYNVYHAWKKDIHQDLQRLHERHGQWFPGNDDVSN
ncbi:uncharacterized protein A1O9_12956 [Exophiala aquamarina CBS 119918]|uniref:Uncharacterized protein n=1 Tax=Exophiala aquamarina CBS 119918 TaxID=1182545 RepID=A0A072NSY5_9EURO|nr:uncharacterized protein A1O9_12956 [Exophiala aquamarina CBS 119918]KEF50979.1 hypothetical protein A1O9_12956 [Exophiala aquamarina CBS 119918]